jgi:hypothetical protein
MINSPLVKGVLITQILYDLTKYLRYLSHEAPEVERNTEVDQTNRYDFSQEELWAKEGVSLPLYLLFKPMAAGRSPGRTRARTVDPLIKSQVELALLARSKDL